MQFFRTFAIHRSKCCLQFQIANDLRGIMLQAATSSGERRYNWKQKTLFLLTDADLGKLNDLFTGHVNQISFFHPYQESQKEGKTWFLTTTDHETYVINTSLKDPRTNNNISCGLTRPDIFFLKEIVRRYISLKFGTLTEQTHQPQTTRKTNDSTAHRTSQGTVDDRWNETYPE